MRFGGKIWSSCRWPVSVPVVCMVTLNDNCNGCQEALDVYEHNYSCKECNPYFQLCEACRFAESVSHNHKLIRVPALARDYPYFVKESPKSSARGNKLVLGSYSSCLPHSAAIQQENIKCVLSLFHMDLTAPPKERGARSIESMHQIFFPGGKYQSLVRHEDVIYYHVNVPDLADPAQLSTYQCEDFLPKGVLFIEYALRIGNVLVHCEKGQRRSPTIFLGWLCYHKISLLEAIDMIAIGYEGDEDWGESYKRHRNLWIEGPLDKWQSKSKPTCAKWIRSHASTIRKWKFMMFPESIEKTKPIASVLTKRKRIEEESSTDENVPANKRLKVTA